MASFERVSLWDECGRNCSQRERKSIYAEAGFVKMRPCHPNISAPGRWGRQRNCWRLRRQFRSAANVGGHIVFLRRVPSAHWTGWTSPGPQEGKAGANRGPQELLCGPLQDTGLQNRFMLCDKILICNVNFKILVRPLARFLRTYTHPSIAAVGTRSNQLSTRMGRCHFMVNRANAGSVPPADARSAYSCRPLT